MQTTSHTALCLAFAEAFSAAQIGEWHTLVPPCRVFNQYLVPTLLAGHYKSVVPASVLCQGNTHLMPHCCHYACYRLYLMLEAVYGKGHHVVEFSSHLSSQQRAKALESFRAGGHVRHHGLVSRAWPWLCMAVCFLIDCLSQHSSEHPD